MIQDAAAVLFLFLLLGSLAAVIAYYVLDHSNARDKPLMKSIRGSMETMGAAFDGALRFTGRTLVLIVVAALGLVILLALLKWALEELAK